MIRYNQTLFYIGIREGKLSFSMLSPRVPIPFKEMSESELARRFNVDFDDICSEVWEFWKQEHHKGK